MPKKSKKSKDKDADSAAESSDAEKAPPVPETAEEKRRREHCEDPDKPPLDLCHQILIINDAGSNIHFMLD